MNEIGITLTNTHEYENINIDFFCRNDILPIYQLFTDLAQSLTTIHHLFLGFSSNKLDVQYIYSKDKNCRFFVIPLNNLEKRKNNLKNSDDIGNLGKFWNKYLNIYVK